MGIASVALNAVTAGVAAGIVKRFMSDATPVRAAKQELVKVFGEVGSASIVEKGVSEAMKGNADRSGYRSTAGGTLLSLETFFEVAQQTALSDTMQHHVNSVESSLDSLASRLDREQPGAGYRVAVQAHDAIEAEYEHAFDSQFSNSLQAWCTFSAQARLGRGDKKHRGRDPGTELGTQVDVDKIFGGDRPTRHLDQTPGVLRLELGEMLPGQFVVIRSFIAGFNGDTVVKNLSRKVQDLHIPMVARFNERNQIGNTKRRFVIGRNENGAVLADSRGSVMQDLFGGKSDHEAARLIFEQIAHQTITPERG